MREDALGLADQEVVRAADGLDASVDPPGCALCRCGWRVELVALGHGEQLRPGVVARYEARRWKDAERRGDEEPSGDRVVQDRQGDVRAERPARDDHARSGIDAHQVIEAGFDVELLVDATPVGECELKGFARPIAGYEVRELR